MRLSSAATAAQLVVALFCLATVVRGAADAPEGAEETPGQESTTNLQRPPTIDVDIDSNGVCRTYVHTLCRASFDVKKAAARKAQEKGPGNWYEARSTKASIPTAGRPVMPLARCIMSKSRRQGKKVSQECKDAVHEAHFRAYQFRSMTRDREQQELDTILASCARDVKKFCWAYSKKRRGALQECMVKVPKAKLEMPCLRTMMRWRHRHMEADDDDEDTDR